MHKVPPSLLAELDRQRVLDDILTVQSMLPDPVPRANIQGPPYRVRCGNCEIRFTIDYLPHRCPWCSHDWT